jgi:hypothetical protein
MSPRGIDRLFAGSVAREPWVWRGDAKPVKEGVGRESGEGDGGGSGARIQDVGQIGGKGKDGGI